MNDTPTTFARKLAQRAMGGELDLVASFPDRPAMKIRSLGEVPASRAASPSPGRLTSRRPMDHRRRTGDTSGYRNNPTRP